MNLFQALILGLVQGLTEFLPISSSGHMILVPALLGWPQQSLAFDAVTNVATLLAVVIALRADLFAMVRREKQWDRLAGMILVATLPVLVVGFLFKDVIETSLRNPYVVAGSLALWGVLLFIADRRVERSASQGVLVNDVRRVSWKAVVAIGLAQAIALIPGTSRSGVTITAGLFSGLNRETAARFSFLLGIPAIAAGSALALLDFTTGKAVFDLWPCVVGFLASFVSGLFAIQFLLKLLKGGSYVGFAVYRVILAVIVLLVFLR